MTCLVTKISQEHESEHWRVLVTEKGEETYHDSAMSEDKAISLLLSYLTGRKSE